MTRRMMMTVVVVLMIMMTTIPIYIHVISTSILLI